MGSHIFDTQNYRLLTGTLMKFEDCEGGHKYTQTYNVRVTLVPIV
jgi:hypothetical protein